MGPAIPNDISAVIIQKETWQLLGRWDWSFSGFNHAGASESGSNIYGRMFKHLISSINSDRSHLRSCRAHGIKAIRIIKQTTPELKQIPATASILRFPILGDIYHHADDKNGKCSEENCKEDTHGYTCGVAVAATSSVVQRFNSGLRWFFREDWRYWFYCWYWQ